MARHRPTEVKAVVALLEREHEDVEVLAQELLDLLMDIKWKRSPWIAIQRHRRTGSGLAPDLTCWGPYPTRKQAELDVGRRIIAGEPGEHAYFAVVTDKDVTAGPDPETWEES